MIVILGLLRSILASLFKSRVRVPVKNLIRDQFGKFPDRASKFPDSSKLCVQGQERFVQANRNVFKL